MPESKELADVTCKPTVMVTGGGSSDLEENPMFNKGKKEDLGNYKLVIITLITAKLIRQLILGTILRQMKDKQVLRSSLDRFMKEKSCLTHLIAFCNEMTDLVDGCRVVIAVYLNLLRSLTLFSITSSLTN